VNHGQSHSALRAAGWTSLALAVFLAACGFQAAYPIRIGTVVWPGYEALYLARSLGHHDDIPVKMVEFGNTPEALRAFQNGVVEAVAITGDEFVRLAASVPDVRAVLVLDFSHGGDVVLGAEGVQNPSELKGRRIAFEPNSVSMYFLNRFLEHHSIPRESVELVPIPLERHEQALLNLEVDAVATYEPQATRLRQTGANLIFDSSQIPGEIFDLLVVREELARRRPGHLAAILAAHLKTLEFIRRNPGEAAERMAPRVGVDPGTMRAIMGKVQLPTGEENVRLLLPGGDLAGKLALIERDLRRWGWIQGSGASNLVAGEFVSEAMR